MKVETHVLSNWQDINKFKIEIKGNLDEYISTFGEFIL